MSRSLASVLKDFGDRPVPVAARRLAVADVDKAGAGLPVFTSPAVDPGPDVDSLIAEAVAAAEAALSARLAEDHAEALRIERERHQEELAAVNRQVAEEASLRMQASVDNAERKIVDLTSAVVSRILGGVLTEDMRERSLERLAATIRDALADDDALRIRVRGSLPLYEALMTRLDGRTGQLDFTESPAFDLSVAINDSVYETRLAEWSAALAEALA